MLPLVPGFTVNNRTASIADVIAGMQGVVVSAPEQAATQEAQSPAAQMLELWPAMARLVIASGDAAAYRLYIYLWNLCKATGGWVSLANVIHGEAGQNFGGTFNTRKRLVKRGAGRYWFESDDRLWLVGAQRLYPALQEFAESRGVAGYDEPNTRKMLIPAESIHSLKAFNAACLNAWISERKGSSYQVTWRVLCAQWGKSRRTLYDWIRLAGVKSTENYGRRWVGTHKRGAPHVFDVVVDESSGNPQVITNQAGQLWAYFQRGNTYVGNAPYNSKGACKAINAHSGNYTGDRPGDGAPGACAEQWEGNRPKANFASIDALLKHKKKRREVADNAYVRQPKRSNSQRALWSLDR